MQDVCCVGIAGTAVAASKNAVENNSLNEALNKLFGASKKQAEYECYTSGICENLSDDQRDLVIYEQTAINAQRIVEPYEQANETLTALDNFALDFTLIIGDAKAFAEDEDGIDYAIASVGIIPSVGDAVGKVLKEVKAALKLGGGKTATELYQKAQQMVSDFIHNKKVRFQLEKLQLNHLMLALIAI